MMMQQSSCDPESFLGKSVKVVIDRPLGSSHPKWGFTYPVNYGYVPGILAADDEFLDAYILGVSHPIADFEGRCIALIQRHDDNEDKLIVVPQGLELTDAEIANAIEFQERFFKSTILRP